MTTAAAQAREYDKHAEGGTASRTIRTVAVPRHVRCAASAAAMPAILDREVTLALWQRPSPLNSATLYGFSSLRLTGRVEQIGALLLDQLCRQPTLPWQQTIAEDVALLASLYADIMKVGELDVRLERVTGNACWKFHADYVSVRLITTYLGRGTEWLDQAAAERYASGGDVQPHRLAPGDVGLFKGRDWAPDTAIVHRSPPIAGSGEERLLLVIDPVRRHD